MSSIISEQKVVVLETKNKELPGAESQRRGVFQRFNKPVKCQLIEADDKLEETTVLPCKHYQQNTNKIILETDA